MTIDGDEILVALVFDEGLEAGGRDAGVLQKHITCGSRERRTAFDTHDSYMSVLNYEGCIRQYKPVKLKKSKIEGLTGIEKVCSDCRRLDIFFIRKLKTSDHKLK